MREATEVLEWRGRTAVGADGSKLGKIEEIYLDAETRRPEWALIQTGMFGGKSSFMPLEGATSDGDQVQAPFSKDQVKDAPQMEPDGELSQQDEAALYSHYGLDYDESRSDSGLPEGGGSNGGKRDRADDADMIGHDTSGPTTDDAMTRSEEELSIGTTKRETGKARLVKHIVTENVTKTVPVQHEEVRIEREPITDANRDAATAGGELTEEEHEVTLHEDEVVVDKQTRAQGARADGQGHQHRAARGLRGSPQGADRDRGQPRPPLARSGWGRPRTAGLTSAAPCFSSLSGDQHDHATFGAKGAEEWSLTRSRTPPGPPMTSGLPPGWADRCSASSRSARRWRRSPATLSAAV
jgi:uncharacterized protein (TIGR02271 family)